MKKILHITNWYPNKWHNLEGVFVKEQFKVFSEVIPSHLINVQVRHSNNLFKYKHIKYSDVEEGFYIFTRIQSAKIIEILTSFLLLWSLSKSKYKNYKLLHFHIAYPLLNYYSWWKKLIKLPLVISEHWSAYHYNFYLPKSTKKLNRVKNIFKQNIPLITVSKALLHDIQKFSGSKDFPSIVIPNVIDRVYFDSKNKSFSPEKPIFFIVNVWRRIKNPFPMLDAFSELSKSGFEFELRIGGYGELISEMKAYVLKRDFGANVSFLGKLNNQEIAKELSRASAYLFSSDFETFSVACAQALSSGCPLIGPPLSAILEYAEANEDIVIVENNLKQDWINSILFFNANASNYKRDKIAKKAAKLFSVNKIKKSYYDFIKTYIKN